MPSNLVVYNTLSRSKEKFEPLVLPGKPKNEVWMYVCGVTPYDFSHVGHGRCYVAFDVIRRYLEFAGYSVKHVQNFTDVEDKILKRAAEINENPVELAARFSQEYFTDARRLHIKEADVYPRVSTHIPHIIALIERLIANGHAYANASGVYFSVSGFAAYGKLSGQSLDSLKAGARVEVDEKKNAPEDFALWKSTKPHEALSWDSPWGKGRPGWHIECSAMCMAHLGEQIDLHGGGQDLTFPHHENEIAQSEAATGKKFAKYWLHNGFVMSGADKMSKSLGNFLTLRDALNKLGDEVLRFLYVSSHYRQPTDFSDPRIEATKGALHKFKEVLAYAESAASQKPKSGPAVQIKFVAKSLAVIPDSDHVQVSDFATAGSSDQLDFLRKGYERRFVAAMDDDFNTPEALGVLSNYRDFVNYLARLDGITAPQLSDTIAHFRTLSGVLGLFTTGVSRALPPGVAESGILALLDAREAAKKARNFKHADSIRAELKAKGILVEDTPNGPKWSVAA